MAFYSVDKGDRGEVRLNGEIIKYAIECETGETGHVKHGENPPVIGRAGLITTISYGNVEFIRFKEKK